MSNEEIERAAESFLRDFDCENDFEPTASQVADFVRQFVSQAYEEAAQIFEEMCSARTDFDGKPFVVQLPACGVCFYCGKAEQVRALKDSLLQKTDGPIASDIVVYRNSREPMKVRGLNHSDKGSASSKVPQ